MQKFPRIVFLTSALCALLVLAAAPVEAQMVTELIAAQNETVGAVTITNDGVTATATYQITEPEWCIIVTHFYAKNEPPAKAAPGRFNFKNRHPCVQTASYDIPLAGDLSGGFFAAAHAEVVIVDDLSGRVTRNETAWGFGPFPMPTGWGWYFTFIVE
jgi:hypothetical protein